MTVRWFVFRVNPTSARLVVARLVVQAIEGLELYLPIEQRRVCRRGAVSVLERPLFGPYLFCQLDLEGPALAPLQRQRGIHGLVRIGPNILAVRDDEIEAVRRQENARGVIPFANVQNIFKPGQAVRVTDGPFTSFPGTVTRIDTAMVEREDYQGRKQIERVAIAVVDVSIFGRSTPVELQESQLEEVG